MNETHITLLGNAVEDPVRRVTSAGDPFVTFRYAVTVRRRRPGTDEYVDAGTSFYDIVAFRGLARHVAASVTKGQPLVVFGRQRVKEWTNGDRRGTNVEIEALSVGHDLRRGTASFARSGGPLEASVSTIGPADPAASQGADLQGAGDGRRDGAAWNANGDSDGDVSHGGGATANGTGELVGARPGFAD